MLQVSQEQLLSNINSKVLTHCVHVMPKG